MATQYTNMNLTGKYPKDTYTLLAQVTGSILVDGTGTQVQNLSVSQSFRINDTQVVTTQQSSVPNFSASFSGSTTGSIGFANQAQFTAFVTDVSSSLVTINSVLSRLKTHGLIATP